MPHYRLTLAYDGTDFAGFQAQAEGRGRTVQGVLEEGLARLCGRPGSRVAVSAAGRTDAGVHALGQVVSFHLDRPWRAPDLTRALNGVLPEDARALHAQEVDETFHARRSALSKLYRYVLDVGPVQLPTRRRYAGRTPGPLDRGAVLAAAALFPGRHDFASLASTGGGVETTLRTVLRSEVRYEGETLLYEVEADGFLRKMVRSMVGGLLAAGLGSVRVEELAAALQACDRGRWPAPAEARGLFLVEVRYPPEGSPRPGPVLR